MPSYLHCIKCPTIRYLFGSAKFSHSYLVSHATSQPTKVQDLFNITDNNKPAKERTAASSGLNAPFAILCLPGLNFLLRTAVALFDAGSTTSRASHSSSVGMCPSSKEKNLCRRTVLIRSKACAEYHPSRSCISLSVNAIESDEAN
jgi:hypothetical protein